jgi:hypothetical protein
MKPIKNYLKKEKNGGRYRAEKRVIKEVNETQYHKKNYARCWWFTPVILATQEAEVGRSVA